MCLCEHYLLHVFRFELCYIVGNRTLLVYNIYTRLAKNLNISHLIYISFFPILHKIPLNISPTHCFHIRSCFMMKLCFISKFHVHVLKMCKLCFWMKKKKETHRTHRGVAKLHTKSRRIEMERTISFSNSIHV